MEDTTKKAPISPETEISSCWFTVDEETTMELSKLLESSPHAPPPAKVRFVENPYFSTAVFQSSSAFVTINGNEETCGSSFSDSESSLMASFDVGDALKFLSYGAWSGRKEEARENDDVDYLLVSDEDDLDGEDEAWKEFLGEEMLFD